MKDFKIVDSDIKAIELQNSCPPPITLIKQYEKMKQLYQKIIASEKNVEEWFKNLCEACDTDFVIHNVEYRLGRNLLNKTLWKLYIKFLENVDTKKMLQVYSKYCRFFLDDSEMKEEYKTKVEKYGPVFVHWDAVFDFEKKAVENDEEKEDSDETPQMENRNIVQKFQPFDKNVGKTFYQNYQKQVFPFQQPLMEYILENGNSAVWRKLHQACKYFFVRKLIPICYRLRIQGHTSSFYKEFLELNFNDNENGYLKNTWITTTFFCNYDQSLPTDYLARIIPRLYQCDAKYITIWNQKLSYDELKFFIGSGNVIDLNLLCMRIKDDKNEWINLEKIMEFLPNVEQLQLSNVKFNKNTANLLEKQRFNSKINSLILLDIFGEPFDTTEFLNFTKKNRDEYFFLRMEFKLRQPGFSNEFITAFRNLMEAENDMKNTHIEINFTPM
uniref:Uncharacterized protein n=1 Tax=Panagrolaimus sp. ES5 TaxID=591445 RepID=A0AC34FTZ4_9BILA